MDTNGVCSHHVIGLSIDDMNPFLGALEHSQWVKNGKRIYILVSKQRK